MILKDKLVELGVDYYDGLNRFMGNQALFEKMLTKFPDNVRKLEVLSFIDAGDTATAVANAHTIKGVSGNLSLTPIFEAYTKIVSLLRDGNAEEAKTKLEEILPVQEDIIKAIEEC